MEEWQGSLRVRETGNSVIVLGKYSLLQTLLMT